MKEQHFSPLFQRAIQLILAIPSGKVLTYGQAAKWIGAPGCARHISWILSSSSKKYQLPWHRVISSSGKISLPIGSGYQKQKRLLEKEGVLFTKDRIDLTNYLWNPSKKEVNQLLAGLPKHNGKQT